MFESIKNIFKKNRRKQIQNANSKDTAKERLHLVLMQDRANVSVDFLDLMRKEIIEVIKKYIEIDEKAIDVRLTTEANEDGTQGAPALYANIPIINIKDEARKLSKTNCEHKIIVEPPKKEINNIIKEQENKAKDISENNKHKETKETDKEQNKKEVKENNNDDIVKTENIINNSSNQVQNENIIKNSNSEVQSEKITKNINNEIQTESIISSKNNKTQAENIISKSNNVTKIEPSKNNTQELNTTEITNKKT